MCVDEIRRCADRQREDDGFCFHSVSPVICYFPGKPQCNKARSWSVKKVKRPSWRTCRLNFLSCVHDYLCPAQNGNRVEIPVIANTATMGAPMAQRYRQNWRDGDSATQPLGERICLPEWFALRLVRLSMGQSLPKTAERRFLGQNITIAPFLRKSSGKYLGDNCNFISKPKTIPASF